jgi:HEAT repeat protein
MLKKGFIRVGLAFTLLASSSVAQTPVETAWNILNTATSNTNMEKRMNSISALGLITHDAHAQEIAIRALTSDEKPEVRAAAANALGNMGATSAIPQLTKAMKTDQNAGVVLAAAHSLLMFKQQSAYEVYYAVLTGERKSGQGLMGEQKKMLHDPKKMAQFGFEQGIGFIPFAGMGLNAVKMLTKDDVSPVRAAAAKILANDKDPRSGEALVKAASDKSWIVRAAALDAIARRGQRSLAAQIEPQLEDDKDLVRYVASAAIIRLSKTPAPAASKRK